MKGKEGDIGRIQALYALCPRVPGEQPLPQNPPRRRVTAQIYRCPGDAKGGLAPIGDQQPDDGHGQIRGMPSPRSATMLRWISFVPPAIVPENALMKSNIGLPNGSSANRANA